MEEYLNRHDHPLPDKPCTIEIVHYSAGVCTCRWNPVTTPEDHDEGYLGAAVNVENDHGYNAWQQNDYEFVLYKVLKG